jgi:alpha-tubulin suppressor-like RCC1 family protein
VTRIGLFAAVALLASCYHAHHASCEISCVTATNCDGLAGFETGAICDQGFCSVDPVGTCLPDGGIRPDAGSNGSGGPPLIVSAVAAGIGFACAIDANAHLSCWGDNDSLVVASGEPSDVQPRPVARGTNVGSDTWTQVAAGGHTACAMQGSALYCWGNNTFQQCGPGSGGNGPVGEPLAVPAPPATTWTKVAVGDTHVCGLDSGGDIWCWGNNGFGQFGRTGGPTATSDLSSPAMRADGPWLDVWAGPTMTCGLARAAGAQWEVYCWGDQTGLRLGSAQTTSSPTPVLTASGASRPVKLSIGREAVCGVTEAHNLACYGDNSDDAVGVKQSGGVVRSPTQVDGQWIDVSVGGTLACGVQVGGQLYCWGTGAEGGLGTGLWSAQQDAPVAVSNGSDATAVFVGDTGAKSGFSPNPSDRLVPADTELACATLGSGSLTCWGGNRFGQLGDGAAGRSGTPVALLGATNLRGLVAGNHHACVVVLDKVACWGSTDHGEADGSTNSGSGATPCLPGRACDVQVPTPLGIQVVVNPGTSTTPISAGPDFTCAIGSDTTTVTCWGADDAGQLGSDAGDRYSFDVTTDNGASVQPVSIFASAEEAIVQDTDSNTYGWGRFLLDPNQQLGPGSSPLGSGATISGMSANAVTGVIVTNSHSGEWFGSDRMDEFGDSGLRSSSASPVAAQPGNLYTSVEVSADPTTTFECGIALDEGEVACWGTNAFNVIPGGSSPQPTASDIPGVTGCSQLALGSHHACALCNGSIECWGDNSYGQISGTGSGSGSGGVATVPPPSGTTWAAVATTADGSCGLTSGGELACWGDGLRGELGNGGGGATMPRARLVTQPQ